ncbi:MULTISPECIES: TIGR04452 family lipoprotein [Leptospira]|uniref:TIGR04452 family lipoprotein n=1 Tax=Leptospira TaxID=171 RepID=UPI00214B0939|nr:TIGR04452 family lipoprotein [Leptospira sp. id769339]MCR1795530.1 TIGR04452 family lipoprotein [Leptospira sp. id769339]
MNKFVLSVVALLSLTHCGFIGPDIISGNEVKTKFSLASIAMANKEGTNSQAYIFINSLILGIDASEYYIKNDIDDCVNGFMMSALTDTPGLSFNCHIRKSGALVNLTNGKINL